MSESLWYFVDRAQQRHGPVTAAEIVAAVHAGDATDDSLVWREGLAEWAPLATFRTELGLAPASVAPAPLPPPAMPGPAPGSPPAKSGKGCLVAAIVVGVLVLLVPVLAILAAIALPAYQDYVGRSIVAGAVGEARAHQALVDDFVANTDRCPRDASEIALPAPASRGLRAVEIGEADTGMCTIGLVLGGPGADAFEGERITLSRDSAGDWYCTSDMERRVALPADCR